MSKEIKPKISLGDWIYDKLNLSLTLRLNFKTATNLIGTFFKFNIILIFVLIIAAMYSVDKKLVKADGKLAFADDRSLLALDENIIEYDNDSKISSDRFNYYVPLDGVYNIFDRNSNIVERNLWLRSGEYFINFLDIEYIIKFKHDNEAYNLGYNLKEGYESLKIFMIGVIVIESVFVFTQVFKSKKSIEQSLSPISELTETVKEINGSDLDKRISIVGTQNEFVDLTQEINAMLDRIKNSYASQSRFVSDASHELRTPIAVIQGYANLIDRWGKEDPETLTESIEAIKSETESMKILVEQLLFLARGDRENLAASKAAIEISAITEEIFNESKVIDKDHVYVLESVEAAWIDGDMNLIKQAIRIFMDNAKKYAKEGTTITLGVSEKNERAVITIEDEGIGMTQHEIANMFERFFRADKSRSRKDGGSGLGLSITEQILRLHNADVSVVSVKNIGTKVILSFPMLEKSQIFNIA